jgi:hypothetical protein
MDPAPDFNVMKKMIAGRPSAGLLAEDVQYEAPPGSPAISR